jgi:hypothetical protein
MAQAVETTRISGEVGGQERRIMAFSLVWVVGVDGAILRLNPASDRWRGREIS